MLYETIVELPFWTRGACHGTGLLWVQILCALPDTSSSVFLQPRAHDLSLDLLTTHLKNAQQGPFEENPSVMAPGTTGSQG
jgi:hypothetical protein